MWDIIYTWINSRVDRRLRENDLPDDLDFYLNVDYIDPESGEFVYKTGKRRKAAPKKRPVKDEKSKDENNQE